MAAVQTLTLNTDASMDGYRGMDMLLMMAEVMQISIESRAGAAR